MHFIRFLHVMLAVTLSGMFVANYFYIYLAMKENNVELLKFTLKHSLYIDCLFFLPAILLIFSTGSYQVFLLNLSLHTHWILSAYLFFFIITILWIFLFALKSYSYIFIDNHKFFVGKFFFHISNILILLCLIFIIHDAVRKTTFIPWNF